MIHDRYNENLKEDERLHDGDFYQEYYDSIKGIEDTRKSYKISSTFDLKKKADRRNELDNKVERLERKIIKKKLQRKYR